MCVDVAVQTMSSLRSSVMSMHRRYSAGSVVRTSRDHAPHTSLVLDAGMHSALLRDETADHVRRRSVVESVGKASLIASMSRQPRVPYLAAPLIDDDSAAVARVLQRPSTATSLLGTTRRHSDTTTASSVHTTDIDWIVRDHSDPRRHSLLSAVSGGASVVRPRSGSVSHAGHGSRGHGHGNNASVGSGHGSEGRAGNVEVGQRRPFQSNQRDVDDNDDDDSDGDGTCDGNVVHDDPKERIQRSLAKYQHLVSDDSRASAYRRLHAHKRR